MITPIVLLVILFALMLIIGGKRGARSFFTLFFNFITLFVLIILIACRIDPINITVIGSVIITSITLFYINGVNKKTISSLLSVTIVVILTLLITYNMGTNAKIHRFGYEQLETISYLSLYVIISQSEQHQYFVEHHLFS